MKFILNEELTLDEKKLYPSELKSIAQVMKNKGYNNNQITSTIKDIEDDESGYTAQHWLDQANDYATKQTSDDSQEDTQDGSQVDASQKESDSKDDFDVEDTENNTAQNKESDQEDDFNTNEMPKDVANAVNIIKSNNKKGTKLFLNAIKGQINNTNYPFTALLNNHYKQFLPALGFNGVNEELNEAGPFSTIYNNVKNQVNNKADKSSIMKFLKIYNAFTELDQNVALKYINDDDALIYNKDVMNCITNKYPVDKIINIDAAASLKNEQQKNALRDKLTTAILSKNGKDLEKLSTYTFNSKSNQSQSNVEKIIKAIKSLSKDDQLKLKNAFKEA